MTENSKWELKTHSYQIADTGDYDGHYELTNGVISLITRDEVDDTDRDVLIQLLNEMGCKWEDWKLSDKEFEVHLKQQEVDRWKEPGANLYMVLKTIKIHIEEESPMYKIMTDALDKYEECENNMP